jgi:predicted nucleic acid-binding protein
MATTIDALVLDASVAAKWHLRDEDHADQALSVLERFIAGELVLFAPDQIRYAIASTLASATRGSKPRVDREVAAQALARFLSLHLELDRSAELIRAAFPLVHQHEIALYDALYLALSRRLAIPLITADRRLYQRIRHLPGVIWLGDYSSAPSTD